MKTKLLVFLAAALCCLPADAQTFGYVATRVGTSSSVRVIDLGINQIVNTISMPSVSSISWVTITPDQALGFAGGSGSAVAVFASTLLRYIIIPGASTSAEVTADSARLYVVNSGRLVTVIDTGTSSIIDTIDLGGSPGARYITFSPDGTRAYVTDRAGFSIIDIDPGSGTYHTVLAYIFTPQEPTGLAVTPDGSKLYLTTNRAILATDLFSYLVYTVEEIASQGIAVSPDGSYAMAAATDANFDMVVVNTATDQVALNTGPQNVSGLAITPDGSRVYALSRRTCPTPAGLIYPVSAIDSRRFNGISLSNATFTWITIR
jgi:YVTN family beta-propeller protein